MTKGNDYTLGVKTSRPFSNCLPSQPNSWILHWCSGGSRLFRNWGINLTVLKIIRVWISHVLKCRLKSKSEVFCVWIKRDPHVSQFEGNALQRRKGGNPTRTRKAPTAPAHSSVIMRTKLSNSTFNCLQCTAACKSRSRTIVLWGSDTGLQSGIQDYGQEFRQKIQDCCPLKSNPGNQARIQIETLEVPSGIVLRNSDAEFRSGIQDCGWELRPRKHPEIRPRLLNSWWVWPRTKPTINSQIQISYEHLFPYIVSGSFRQLCWPI